MECEQSPTEGEAIQGILTETMSCTPGWNHILTTGQTRIMEPEKTHTSTNEKQVPED